MSYLKPETYLPMSNESFAQRDPKTLEALIRQAAARMDAAGLFFGHGTDNALDEACWMASSVFGLPPDFDDAAVARTATEDERQRFETLLADRIQTRRPLAYLLGQAWFAGLPFTVNENVLVPRSPLAELIVEGFAPWVEPERLERVVDVGTGSGCLAVATAYYWPDVKVDAVDISPDALALARRNAERHGVADRVEVIESDLLDALEGRRYDVILANPPYVPTASMETLPREYRWEPRLGLEAGEDGLDLVRRLLDTAADHLEDDGVMIVEVGEAAEALEQLLLERGIEFTWLAFEHGGDGVALIEREALAAGGSRGC
jgi:ribosomal protein L3 glutamine methyltransferase